MPHRQKTGSESKMKWENAIRAVAFDMDGLLLNTEEVYLDVGTILLERRGRPYRAELRRGMMGLPGKLAIELMIREEALEDDADALLEESDQVFMELLPSRLGLMPGVLEAFEWLEKHRLPCCVATSSRRKFAEDCLTRVGLKDRLQFIVTAEDVPRGKPYPDIYHAAAVGMNVKGDEMLALEDSGHGCRAAVTSGACTIAVPGSHSADHSFDGAFYIANTLLDPQLRAWLDRAVW
ncbi:MAG: HAD family phosphatase [Planctomycetaceae bacterium]|nr:HAD family phosphatase [Planctomycetaceae bacterium]